MNIKRLLTAILALTLTLSLFACGNAPEETTSKTETSEETTTVKETEETTEENTTEEITTIKETEATTVEETTTEEITTVRETEETTEDITTEETTSEVTTTDEITSEETTETETEVEETTRFDYFGADIEEYITMESGALESIELELSSEYLVDENDVKDVVNMLIFDYRIPLNDGEPSVTETVQFGDSAFIYFKGYIDGIEFEGGSNWDDEEPWELAIGSGEFVPGFEEQLIGTVPSSTSKENPAKITVTFPEDYYEEYAGKEAVFDVYVAYVVKYELPEYNEDFILGELEYEPEESCTDVVAEFEAGILEELQASADEMIELEKEAILWDHLLESATVLQYPRSEVEFYYNSFIVMMEEYRDFYAMMGLEFDTFDEFAVDLLGLEAGADWQAVVLEKYVYTEIKLHLIFQYVADELSIELTEEDIRASIESYMNDYGMTEEEVLAQVEESMLMEHALQIRITTLLLESATVVFN